MAARQTPGAPDSAPAAILATPEPDSGGPTEAELLAAFDEVAIPPGRSSATYRLGLLLVMVAMVLLPLVYIGLIGAIGYGVWYHAARDHTILTAGHGATRGRLLAYLGPIVVGVIGLLFMVKPLFAPRRRRPPTYALDPARYPLLFRFVERLCQAVGAPVPRRIDVDTQVNASASFRRGLHSFLGDDLVLTIGLPLVAGMTLRQLAGVLAHEFGHFAQGSGMRLTYIIRSINAWFYRVVYERDAWDARLDAAARQSSAGLWVIVGLSRGFVWITRQILWGLMWVGNVISSFALRQMEYDADRHEAHVAGSDTFERTADRLVVLAVASQGAHADLQRSWQADRLADDLPALVLANVEELRQLSHAPGPGGSPRGDVLGRIVAASREQATGLFDTHPSNRDRIAAARALEAPGMFRVEAPASRLFPDFRALCREVTHQYYREVIGLEVGPDQLVPTALLVTEQAETVEGVRALSRYVQGRLPTGSGFRLFLTGGIPPPAGPGEVGAVAAALADARARMLAGLPALREALEAYLEADRRADEAADTAALMAAGLRVPSSGLKPDAAGRALADAARERTAAGRDEVLRRLDEAAGPFRDRLTAALRLRGVEPTEGPPGGVAPVAPDRVEALAAALAALRDGWPAVYAVVERMHELGLLLANLEGKQDNAGLVGAIRSRADALRAATLAAREALIDSPYPFEHGGGPTSTGHHLVPEIPRADQLGDLYGTAGAAIERFQALYVRVLSALVVQAERIEAVLGLPRLPDPPPEEALEASAGPPEATAG